ncbi:MAG: YdjY domain-containing protein, partial [Planctomycetota bacterium]
MQKTHMPFVAIAVLIASCIGCDTQRPSRQPVPSTEAPQEISDEAVSTMPDDGGGADDVAGTGSEGETAGDASSTATDPPAEKTSALDPEVLEQPLPSVDEMTEDLDFVDPAEIVRNSLSPPPGGKRLGEESLLYLVPGPSATDATSGSKDAVGDADNPSRFQDAFVVVDGYVSIQDGPLEFFASPAGARDHETVVGAIVRSRDVHAALLALGAEPGNPILWDSENQRHILPKGPAIAVWAVYRDANNKIHVDDARQWVRVGETEKTLDQHWVFGGSITETDEETGTVYYAADGG